MVRLMIVAVALVASVACTLPVKTSSKNNSEILDSISYIRDRHGNCLAVMLSSTYYSYKVVSLTQVDKGCE